jgi:hypothetical protein
MTKDRSIAELFTAMKSPDESTRDDAQKEFSRRYFIRLSKWAKKRLHPALRSLIDEEGVANSVCRTVMRRAKEIPEFADYFLTSKPNTALCHILVQKLFEIGIHYQDRQCRDARRTQQASEMAPGTSPFDPEAEGNLQNVDWVDLVWQETLQALKQQLDEKDRFIIDRLVDGRGMAEIGQERGFGEGWAGVRIERHILPVARRYWPEWAEWADRQESGRKAE